MLHTSLDRRTQPNSLPEGLLGVLGGSGTISAIPTRTERTEPITASAGRALCSDSYRTVQEPRLRATKMAADKTVDQQVDHSK